MTSDRLTNAHLFHLYFILIISGCIAIILSPGLQDWINSFNLNSALLVAGFGSAISMGGIFWRIVTTTPVFFRKER